MTDRELLELAAKAAGVEAEWFRGCSSLLRCGSTVAEGGLWNPLEDDGDALRLAVKLHMNIEVWNTDNFVRANVVIGNRHCGPVQRYKDDPYAATRRAIVRAAAEIGRGMK